MKINYVRLILLNFLYLVILEILFKIFVLDVFDFNILYTIIFSFSLAIVFTFISSLFKNKIINKIISIIIWGIVCFIFVGETVYYDFYKTICGVSALTYGGQVMEFYNEILMHIKANACLITVDVILFVILLVLCFSKKINYEKFNLRSTLLLFVSSIILASSSLFLFKDDVGSAYKLVFKTNNLIETTNKLGLLTSVNLDAFKYIDVFEEQLDLSSVSIREHTLNSDIEYNITNIDFDSLIASESDSTVKQMHSYFKNATVTEQNQYTGIFAGKNLIFITAEGFSPIAVNEELTPTLYKLVNNGFVFKNYYQPIYSCSTSDGEFINLLSILPGVSLCSMNSTKTNYLPYSIGNIMKNYGYKTYAFHGWTYDFYDRDVTHPNLGFDYYGYDTYNTGFKNALKGITYSWPTSDIEVVNSSYDIYANDDNFVAYYMSISGHLQYNFYGNAIAYKNKSLVEDLNTNDAIKAYIATQIEFDKSLEILMNDLEKSGKLDDTVIVIAADHYPYGLTNEEIEDYVDYVENENFDIYKNNLVIYNSEMENVEVDKYTSSLDILPTLLNLFGVKYDSRLLMGTDVFSSSDALVIFNNKSWITDKGEYDYLKKKFISFTDEEVSQEYIDEINNIVQLKFQMSKLLISKDYYRKVFGE